MIASILTGSLPFRTLNPGTMRQITAQRPIYYLMLRLLSERHDRNSINGNGLWFQCD
jgi:hypothetical protein